MNSSRNDNDLIARFRAGDRQAFKELYLYYYNRIFFFANRLVKNADEADDITSDTFFKLWRQRASFASLSNVRAFLYMTCRNACYDYLRSRQSHHVSHEEIRYLSRQADGASEREMIEPMILREIQLLVKTLPPRCQEVFRLLFFQKKKAREVAVQLGISLSTVHAHKSSAIRKLREALSRKDLALLEYFPL